MGGAVVIVVVVVVVVVVVTKHKVSYTQHHEIGSKQTDPCHHNSPEKSIPGEDPVLVVSGDSAEKGGSIEGRRGGRGGVVVVACPSIPKGGADQGLDGVTARGEYHALD